MQITSNTFHVQGRISGHQIPCYSVVVEDERNGAKAFGKYCDNNFILSIPEDLRNSSMKEFRWKVTYIPEDKEFKEKRYITVIPSKRAREGIYYLGESNLSMRELRDHPQLEKVENETSTISLTRLLTCLCLFLSLYGMVAYFHLKRVVERRYKQKKRVIMKKRGYE